MFDVSVVVPTFRRPRMVTEAIQSALSQPGVSVEVVVVDDSPEGSAQSEVESIANARVADGAYAALVAALDAHPAVAIAFGRVEPFGDDPVDLLHNQQLFAESARARLGEPIHSPQVLLSSMLICNPCLACSACLIRREAMAELGAFDAQMTPFEDAELFIRGIRRYGSTFVDRPVLRYRTGISSLMHNLSSDTGPIVDRRIYRKYGEEHGRLELFAMKVLARTLLRHI